MQKYFRPNSITWWSGLAMLAYGITLVVQGDAENGVKNIVEGLAIVGIRAAIGGGNPLGM